MTLPLFEKPIKFQFQIQGLSSKTGVVEMAVEEALSRPFRADLVLASEEDVALGDALSQEGLLTIEGEKSSRHIHGVVTRFAGVGKKGRFRMYEARVEPRWSLLAHEKDCRIFQKKTVREMVTEVLKGAHIGSDTIDFRLRNESAAREFCVQYQETDLAFLSRLLEEEGIWYCFTHSTSGHNIVFADAPSAVKAIEGTSTLSFKEVQGMTAMEEVIFDFSRSNEMRPGKFVQTDFNPLKPSTSLLAEEEGDKNQSMEIYEYPGAYDDMDTGKKRAKIRLQEQSAMIDMGRGESLCPRLMPGHSFTLKDHDAGAFNREYLVVAVHHQGYQPQTLEQESGDRPQSYANTFTVIPSNVPYRPERKTPRPVVQGPQTAIVTGPDGEEIYTDEHGRVKVRFHWDRLGKNDEKSSCWIRVSQAWAGEGWGAMFLPRTGHEVIVSFLDGDPDRPLITGRVYNGANPPPHALPDNKTKSTLLTHSSKDGKGANELTFEDAKDSEEITLVAQKDLKIKVKNNKNQSIAGNEELDITGKRSATVGKNERLEVKENRTVSVGKDFELDVEGNKKEEVNKESTEKVDGNKTVTVGKSFQEDVAQDRKIKTGKTHSVDAETITVTATKSILLKNDQGSIKITQNGDIVIKGKNITLDGSGNIKVKGNKIGAN